MDLVGGAMDPRGGYVSKNLHVKMRESGPIGGARAGRAPLDPPMFSIRFWRQYVSSFPPMAAIVSLLLTSNRESSH